MITSLKQYKSLILEKTENQKYSSGCIMGYFNDNPMDNLSSGKEDYEIAEDDIFNNEDDEFGREIQPHLTILYGLKDDVEESEVVKFLKLLKMPTVMFEDVSCFKNDNYEVLKWDIDKYDKTFSEVCMINKLACAIFPYENKFPEYCPHSTIAYLKPGTGDKYSVTPNNIVNLPIKSWVYSQSNGRKISIDENGSLNVIREANDDSISENLNSKTDDKSYEYNGYWISLTPMERFENRYFCCVKKDKNDVSYLMALKGPVSFENGKKSAEFFINGTIAKKK